MTRVKRIFTAILVVILLSGLLIGAGLTSSAEVSTFRKYEVSPLYSYLTFNSGLYTFSPEPDEIHVLAAKGTNYHFQFNTKYQLSLDAPYGVASVERIDYILSFEWTSFYNQTIFDSICLYFKIGKYSFRFDNDRFIDFSYKTDFKRDIDGNIIDYNTRVYTLDFSFDPTGFPTPMTGDDNLLISINCIDRYYSDSDEATAGYFTFKQQYLAVQYTQKEYEDVREEQLDDVNSNLSDMNSNFDDVNSNLDDVNSNLGDINDFLENDDFDDGNLSSDIEDMEVALTPDVPEDLPIADGIGFLGIMVDNAGSEISSFFSAFIQPINVEIFGQTIDLLKVFLSIVILLFIFGLIFLILKGGHGGGTGGGGSE